MRRLRNPSITPPEPKHFSYTHEETGHTTGPCMTYEQWIEQSVAHRRAMNLPIPANLQVLMEDQLCQTLSPDWCQYEAEGRSTFTNVRLALADIVTVTKALLDTATGDYVSQEEAERRARICGACYLNVHVSGCGVCHQLATLIAKDRSTPYDDQLKNCAVCTCNNRAQVWMHLDTLSSHGISQRQDAYPSFCWQKVGSVNYIDS